MTMGAAPPPAKRRGTWLTLAPVGLFAALAILFAFALGRGDPSKLPSALIGKPVPALTLAPVEGLTDSGRALPGFSAADLAKGEPTVVNFWASWCQPCVEEHPLLIALAKRTGVAVVGVNYKDQPESARRFLARLGNPFRAVGADPAGRVAIEWGVYGMPESFVIDGRGTIVYKHVGPITAETLDKRILPAIERARQGK
jgi:cytochrome c biogenesis protein CcmG/thiol:disulfide interchange protein DsbE